MPHRPLDRNSFAPLYYQLAEKIQLLIDRDLVPGDQVPSEAELTARYNVSRNTVRQALDALAQQGFVIRVQGKGTYVSSEHNRYSLQKLVSFSEDMRRRGLHPETRFLGLATLPPPFSRLARELRLAPGELVYELRRLRLADGVPMALNTTYLPQKLFPDLTDQTLAQGSLFEYINSHLPAHVGYADRVLKSVIADDAQAELLQVEVGSPLMLVEGPGFLDNDQPVEYVITFYRGDRYEFVYHPVRLP